MYKLIFFVPDSHLETVKDALFQAGAGRIGLYSHCAWQTKGMGQFKPLEGSQPFLGEKDTLHYEEEWRVEMVFSQAFLVDIVVALKKHHPYETPAFDILPLIDTQHIAP